MYKVTNTGINLRVVPTALGPVQIPRDKMRDGLHLTEGVAQHLRRAQLKGAGVSIEGTDDETRAVLERANQTRRGFNIHGNNRRIIVNGDGTPASALLQDKDEVAEDIRKLLAEVDTMRFPELRARAMILLGPRWPEGIGITARRQVRELLERAIAVEPETAREGA